MSVGLRHSTGWTFPADSSCASSALCLSLTFAAAGKAMATAIRKDHRILLIQVPRLATPSSFIAHQLARRMPNRSNCNVDCEVKHPRCDRATTQRTLAGPCCKDLSDRPSNAAPPTPHRPYRKVWVKPGKTRRGQHRLVAL